MPRESVTLAIRRISENVPIYIAADSFSPCRAGPIRDLPPPARSRALPRCPQPTPTSAAQWRVSLNIPARHRIAGQKKAMSGWAATGIGTGAMSTRKWIKWIRMRRQFISENPIIPMDIKTISCILASICFAKWMCRENGISTEPPACSIGLFPRALIPIKPG